MSLLVLLRGRALRVLTAVVAITAAAPSVASAALPSTARVSVSSTAAEANGVSGRPSVSADGRFVAFESNANNLAGTDANGTTDVFLRDRQSGQTLRVSSAPNGAAGNGTSSSPAMSADGRLVVFVSTATTLVPGSTGAQLFLYDRVANAVRRLPDLVSGYVSPSTPVISNDGARVVYRAVAGSRADVFAVDVATGATRRVSERSDGAAGDGTGGFNAFDPAISGDGRWVAFGTNATDLAPPDANTWRDIVGRDLATGALARLSVGSGNAEANLHSSTPGSARTAASPPSSPRPPTWSRATPAPSRRSSSATAAPATPSW
jgi:Tol biopolymer transport system component